ncbi:MAG: hypothetical protein ABSD12_25270, partial [Paraburkholderia sp.]
MNGRGLITISMHELERVKIIEAVVQHRLTIVLAAELSEPQKRTFLKSPNPDISKKPRHWVLRQSCNVV